MMELTRCDENAASYALHDCGYDVDEAVGKIIEGKFSSDVNTLKPFFFFAFSKSYLKMMKNIA